MAQSSKKLCKHKVCSQWTAETQILVKKPLSKRDFHRVSCFHLDELQFISTKASHLKTNRSISSNNGSTPRSFQKKLLSKLQRSNLPSNTKPPPNERLKPREKPAFELGKNPKKLLKDRYFTEEIQNKTPRIRNLASNKKSSRHKQRILPVNACFLLPLVLKSLGSTVHHNSLTTCNECLCLWLCYAVLGDLWRPSATALKSEAKSFGSAGASHHLL